MANINNIDIVSKVALNPLNNPVVITSVVNNRPAFVGLDNVQLVSFEIHFVWVVITGALSALFGIK